MRIRPQSYLLPAALLICLFFCRTAYSEKKNSVYGEDAERDLKIYNENYKKRAAGSNGDIISYNRRAGNENEYEEYSNNSKSVIRKEANDSRTARDKKNSNPSADDEILRYIVKNGDTLFGIAKRFGVPLKRIQDINNLNENSRIYKGMKLRIPSNNKNRKAVAEPAEKTADSSRPGFLWPLKKVKGYSRDGKDGVKSIGILIKGNPGGEVIASEKGVVKRVGYMRGYGKYIVVKHEKRYITVYSNLMDVDVKAGDTVQKGVRIGNISDDMTLHFQIDRAGKPENPVSLLPGRG